MCRADSPYALLLHECRDHHRCTPAALRHSLSETVNSETALRSRNNFWSLDDYDRVIVAEAKSLIERFSGNSTKVTVLLGESSDGQQMLSDIALMYANKWHTPPRSFTFSDELVPALLTRILAHQVTLGTGDVILVRRDDATWGRSRGRSWTGSEAVALSASCADRRGRLWFTGSRERVPPNLLMIAASVT
jgi:hypothetical protein